MITISNAFVFAAEVLGTKGQYFYYDDKSADYNFNIIKVKYFVNVNIINVNFK